MIHNKRDHQETDVWEWSVVRHRVYVPQASVRLIWRISLAPKPIFLFTYIALIHVDPSLIPNKNVHNVKKWTFGFCCKIMRFFLLHQFLLRWANGTFFELPPLIHLEFFSRKRKFAEFIYLSKEKITLRQ